MECCGLIGTLPGLTAVSLTVAASSWDTRTHNGKWTEAQILPGWHKLKIQNLVSNDGGDRLCKTFHRAKVDHEDGLERRCTFGPIQSTCILCKSMRRWMQINYCCRCLVRWNTIVNLACVCVCGPEGMEWQAHVRRTADTRLNASEPFCNVLFSGRHRSLGPCTHILSQNLDTFLCHAPSDFGSNQETFNFVLHYLPSGGKN